jgi:hypothetical protein
MRLLSVDDTAFTHYRLVETPAVLQLDRDYSKPAIEAELVDCRVKEG